MNAPAYKYSPPEDKTAVQSRRAIMEQFDLWRRWARNDGIIGAVDFPVPPKIGGVVATCRFVLRGVEVSVVCDAWDTYDLNLCAVYLAIQAIRLNEVRGIADTMRAAYTALPGPAAEPMKRDPYEVLGIAHGQPLEVIDAVYRAKAKVAHPDAGGSHAAFVELQDAYERIKADLVIPPA